MNLISLKVILFNLKFHWCIKKRAKDDIAQEMTDSLEDLKFESEVLYAQDI